MGTISIGYEFVWLLDVSVTFWQPGFCPKPWVNDKAEGIIAANDSPTKFAIIYSLTKFPPISFNKKK